MSSTMERGQWMGIIIIEDRTGFPESLPGIRGTLTAFTAAGQTLLGLCAHPDTLQTYIPPCRPSKQIIKIKAEQETTGNETLQ